jgi:ParB family chromosome partitioning protein
VANNAANKNRLGRGLSALLPDEAEEAAGVTFAGVEKPSGAGDKSTGGEILIAPEKLKANPGQPRKHFDGEKLEELAASIKQHGIIQPIIVDKDDEGNFVIIAGERRSRAAALAGLKEVPVIVRSYSDQKRFEVALIENIHRTDLNPIEEAAAYKQLMETAGLSQDEAAERVGKNRSTVANALRLLKLPSRMKEALEEGSLSAGHARAILSLSKTADQEKLFVEINEQGLSVRAAEKRSAIIAAEPGADKAGNSVGNAGKNAKREPELKTMEEQFIRTLGTKVTISGNLKRGRIEIEYYSMDDLDRLYGLLER